MVQDEPPKNDMPDAGLQLWKTQAGDLRRQSIEKLQTLSREVGLATLASGKLGARALGASTRLASGIIGRLRKLGLPEPEDDPGRSCADGSLQGCQQPPAQRCGADRSGNNRNPLRGDPPADASGWERDCVRGRAARPARCSSHRAGHVFSRSRRNGQRQIRQSLCFLAIPSV